MFHLLHSCSVCAHHPIKYLVYFVAFPVIYSHYRRFESLRLCCAYSLTYVCITGYWVPSVYGDAQFVRTILGHVGGPRPNLQYTSALSYLVLVVEKRTHVG